MILYTSTAANALEKSILYRWIKFFTLLIGIPLGHSFMQSDIELGFGLKIIIIHVVFFIVIYTQIHLSDWLSSARNKKVQLASLKHGKLSLKFDVNSEHDISTIQRIEFHMPSSFRIWAWPPTKNIIRLICIDGTKELKTRYRLTALQSFLDEINCILDEKRESGRNEMSDA
ncbi:hypothetical protein [Halopseudomonas salegens]|uniref:Uncharacterized protein n=1 Tax=Halopseudomonas salegens TaxID=1434072 RepID=A0A1H2G1S8_9GAMM|nr:hypothetical protein [Halopseudomonas salegens]SDU13552.1 hypothetical protein SAMN05216210_1975 [Halopseudomonas salegens]